jgi:hypothetical protein
VVAIVTDANTGRWVRYFSNDYGVHIAGAPLSLDPGGLDLTGERGFAFLGSQRDLAAYGPGDGWETADLGATWSAVGAPWSLAEPTSSRAAVACGAEGCLVGAYAARTGWDAVSGN